MKQWGLCLVLFLAVQGTAFCEGDRYQYLEEDRMVFDSQSGVMYRFLAKGTDIQHVVVDYVNGIVKVNGVIKASGSTDFRNVKEEVILSKI